MDRLLTFIAVVHHDPGSAYGVSFPDLPGCYSGADEAEDVVTNAMEALGFWFEDQPIVRPRNVEELRSDVADDLREGAYLLAVPYLSQPERKRA